MFLKLVDEIKEAIKQGDTTLLAFSTSARKNEKTRRVPNKTINCYTCFGYLVSSNEEIIPIIQVLDGIVHYFLIDVEMKQNIDLMAVARKYVKKSRIIAYKPNDCTLEAVDLFVRKTFDDHLKDRRILLYGNGNLASKSAIRFAERGAEVFIYGRNINKTQKIIEGLNLILPQNNHHQIKQVFSLNSIHELDCLISLISTDRVIGEEVINCLKEKALVLDVGINNFKEEFYRKSVTKNLQKFRLDVRIGFPYSLLSLEEEVEFFFRTTIGRKDMEYATIVSGGYIGEKGDIIVDSIHQPQQIIGVANGIGGLLHESEYSAAIKERIQYIKKQILSLN